MSQKNKRSTRSLYDPSRETVGKIYRDLQMAPTREAPLIGDMTNAMMKDLVTDINEALEAFSKKSEGRPFYLMIHEKKDLQMKNALARRMLYFDFRPYPEDDTTVFWNDPKTDELRFCWSLPHWSEMDNMLANPIGLDNDLIKQIKYWKKNDLKAFGFYYHPEHKWLPNPNWKDRRIESFKPQKAM